MAPRVKTAPRRYTGLEIENLAWDLLRSQPRVRSRLPIDVELLLELQPGIELRTTPGLVTRYSVACCVCRDSTSEDGSSAITVWVDRSVADSRPESQYRRLLAVMLGHLQLHQAQLAEIGTAEDFLALRKSAEWTRAESEASRFAVSLMAPEDLVIRAAEELYAQIIREEGFGTPAGVESRLRNCLAQAFAVTTSQINEQMARWPCQIHLRVKASLAAGSTKLLLPCGSEPKPTYQAELFGTLEE